MRYPEDHKAQTRQRIIEEASRRFRREGVAVTGLQPLMKALGLTHGGFYAHFGSKDELVGLALEHAAEQMDEQTAAVFASEDPLPLFISSYLSDRHRDHPDQGCPLPTLCAELGQRGTPNARTDSLVGDRLALIREALGESDSGRAELILAALVGGLQLARSVQDPALSRQLIERVVAQLQELIRPAS